MPTITQDNEHGKVDREDLIPAQRGNSWDFGVWLFLFTGMYFFISKFHDDVVAIMVVADWGRANLFDIPWLMDNRLLSVCAFYLMNSFTQTPTGLCFAIAIIVGIFAIQSRLDKKAASKFIGNFGGILLFVFTIVWLCECGLLQGPLLNKR